jgi:hypothetical protein
LSPTIFDLHPDALQTCFLILKMLAAHHPVKQTRRIQECCPTIRRIQVCETRIALMIAALGKVATKVADNISAFKVVGQSHKRSDELALRTLAILSDSLLTE